MKKFLLVLAMFFGTAHAEFVVPPTPYPVNDYASVLSRDGKELVAKKLVQLKTETGVQLGVLIVDSLDGTSIEEAAIKVVESWKLGSKNADDGALLMLSIKDHKSRLEIGKGLQGFLTDANSSEILYEMRPLLKVGNYAGALSGAVDTITYDVQKNKADIMRKPVSGSNNGLPLLLLFVLGAVAFVVTITFLGGFIEAYEEKKRRKAMLEAKDKESLKYNESWESLMLLKQMHTPSKPISTQVDPKKLKKFVGTPVTAKHVKDDGGFTRGLVAGAILDEVIRPSHSSYSDDSSSSSSSSSSSDYSSSSSDFSGGGGSFDGGGSSGSW